MLTHTTLHIPLLVIVLILSNPLRLWAAQKSVSLDQAKFEPGREVTIGDAKSGVLGYYKVFVPKGYTPERSWPVIFCYHGLNQKPQLTPFSRILRGEHFIIVGMGYHQRGLDGYSHLKTEDVQILKHVHQALGPRLRMDKTKLFVGGFSKGAFYASGILNQMPDFFAGAILFGGGKYGVAANPEDLKGKPIFVSCGEKDQNKISVKETKDYYGKQGAIVTGEVLPGVGHAVGYKTTKAREWLLTNGPLAGVREKFEQAQAAEKGNKPGEAYTLYSAVAAVAKTEGKCRAAAKAAQAIAEKAKAALSAVEKLVTDKQFAQAIKAFDGLTATYAGSPFGRQAAERAKALKGDPKISGVIQQAGIDAKADAFERRCAEAEKSGNYGQAISLYKRYVNAFPAASRINDVRARLKQLESDKTIQAKIREKQADRDCKTWFRMSENYVKAGMRAKAREYLQKIIDTYGGTTWSEKASKRLDELGQ